MRAAMFAIPMLQILAQRRAENYIRTPAYSGEPIERHMRLNEDQFGHLVDYYHPNFQEVSAGGHLRVNF